MVHAGKLRAESAQGGEKMEPAQGGKLGAFNLEGPVALRGVGLRAGVCVEDGAEPPDGSTDRTGELGKAPGPLLRAGLVSAPAAAFTPAGVPGPSSVTLAPCAQFTNRNCPLSPGPGFQV